MLKRLLLALALAVSLSGLTQLSPAQRIMLLGAGPAPALDCNFGSGSAVVTSGQIQAGPNCPAITFIRATAAWYFLNGLLTQAASGFARVNSSGLLIEQASTNEALWSRDLTNAAWIAVNVTVAKTATGIDGTANSASLLTASAGNGTVFQTFVIGSEVQTFSAYVQRVTGSGEIDITLNGGSSYTNITSLINSTGYTRVNISGTLANASIGFRIVTNGDAINVDVAQMEDLSWATSPIITTSATVTRNAEVATLATSAFLFNATNGMVIANGMFPIAWSGILGVFNISDGTNNNAYADLEEDTNQWLGTYRSGGTNTGGGLGFHNYTPGLMFSIGSYYNYAAGSVYWSLNGMSKSEPPGAKPIAAITLHFGALNTGIVVGVQYIARVRYFTAGSPQRLQQLTQPGQN